MLKKDFQDLPTEEHFPQLGVAGPPKKAQKMGRQAGAKDTTADRSAEGKHDRATETVTAGRVTGPPAPATEVEYEGDTGHEHMAEDVAPNDVRVLTQKLNAVRSAEDQKRVSNVTVAVYALNFRGEEVRQNGVLERMGEVLWFRDFWKKWEEEAWQIEFENRKLKEARDAAETYLDMAEASKKPAEESEEEDPTGWEQVKQSLKDLQASQNREFEVRKEKPEDLANATKVAEKETVTTPQTVYQETVDKDGKKVYKSQIVTGQIIGAPPTEVIEDSADEAEEGPEDSTQDVLASPPDSSHPEAGNDGNNGPEKDKTEDAAEAESEQSDSGGSWEEDSQITVEKRQRKRPCKNKTWKGKKSHQAS